MSNRTNGMLYFQGEVTEKKCVIICSNSILTEDSCMCSSKGEIALGLLVNFAINCWLKTEMYVGLFGFDLS